MAIGQIKALKNVIRNNVGKVFSVKDLNTMVAKELSLITGQNIDTLPITLIFGDLCNGNTPLLKKTQGGYECLAVCKHGQQSNSGATIAISKPIGNMDDSYLHWINPGAYNSTKYEYLIQSVTEFLQIYKLAAFFNKIKSLCDCKIGKCNIKFVCDQEIKSKRTIDNQRQITEARIMFTNFRAYVLQMPDLDLINKVCDYGENLLSEIDKKTENVFRNIKELLGMLKRISDSQIPEELSKDFYKLLNALIEILSQIQFYGDRLGLYIQKYSIIYLCPENIWNAAERYLLEKIVGQPSEDVILNFACRLIESVFAHEYTHHVHMSLMSARPKIEEQVHYDAVLETVAETVQYLFAEEANDKDLIDWMKKHSESGVFPGWGYAGESILRNAPVPQQKNTKLTETELLDMLIGLSVNDWHSAYCLIQAINKNYFAYNKDYVVFFDDKNVWAISKIYVPYTIGKNSLASSRKSLKSDLQAALSKIGTNATGKLYAEFWGKAPKGADIENILFYNIKGKSCFSGLATENLDFTGDENSHGLSNELYYYHYKIEDSIPAISGSLLCEWENYKIAKINSTQTPYAYFRLMKENCSCRKVYDIAEAADNLVLELTVNYPKKKKIKDIGLAVKPMIDGIICGLHSPSDINPIIAKMIADKYSLNENVVSKQLQNYDNTCLPPRNYVNAYRKNVKNSFKWNPADDLLKFVRIIVNEQEKAQLSISGRLFKK